MKLTAIFKDGLLYDVIPLEKPDIDIFEKRGEAYRADFFLLDDELYDLNNPRDINKLPEKFTFSYSDIRGFPPVVLELSYILKIKCGQINDYDILRILIPKLMKLMSNSNVGWSIKDYLQVIRNLYRIGKYKEGSVLESTLRKEYPKLLAYDNQPWCEGEHLVTKNYFEEKNRRYQEYAQLKKLFPNEVPKTVKGYLQIQSKNTQRYQELKRKALSMGLSLHGKEHLHWCDFNNNYIEYLLKYYNKDQRSSELLYCLCSDYSPGKCTGMDQNGLLCNYVFTYKHTPARGDAITPYIIEVEKKICAEEQQLRFLTIHEAPVGHKEAIIDLQKSQGISIKRIRAVKIDDN